MIYRIMAFRYIDRMNSWVEEMSVDGFKLHSVSPLFNPINGQMEYLVVMSMHRFQD